MAGERSRGDAALTPRMEMFVQQLVQGKSQREAYKAAYPNFAGSDKTADEKASKLFARAKVRARYDEMMGKALEPGRRAAIATAREVLEELTAIAMGAKEYPAYNMAGEEYGRKPSMTARIKALELLGRRHKLFTDNVEVAGRDGKAFEVRIEVVE